MSFRNKFWNILTNIDLIIASICAIILTILTFIGVITRYCFNSPISWQGEIQIMCYIWLTYFGLSVVSRKGGHIAIEMIVDELPTKIAKVIEFINLVLFVIIMFYTAYYGWQLVDQLRVTNRISGVLDIPYWLFYLPMPIGFILSTINTVSAEIRKFRHPNEVTEMGGAEE